MVDIARNHHSASSATTRRADVFARLAPNVDGQRSASHHVTGQSQRTAPIALALPVRCLLAGIRIALGWVFLCLLTIGVALILGVGMRFAAAAGAVLTVMMWTVVPPPDSNPFMDDHLIYAAVLVVLAVLAAGNTLGLGRAWFRTTLVRRADWLS